jgi:penicillin-binding protein 1A
MKYLLRLVGFTLRIALLGMLVGGGALLVVYAYLEPQLPSIEELREVRLQVPLRVYSREGLLMGEFGEKRRIPLEYQDFPERLVQAFLAAEDDRFFEHPGVDYQGLLRAAGQLLLTGQKTQGGSTITMQVARNFFLSREKTYTRKLNEILLALKIEAELGKPEILTLYLNKIYLGHRAYGVGAAAEGYYGKSVGELDLAQTAMIAGLPKAPSRFNPVTDPERAVQRRNYVLGRMLKLGYISQDQHDQASSAPVSARLHATKTDLDAPYAAELVRAEMVTRFGEEAYTGGYRVDTTIVGRLQDAATRALREALDDYDRRHGYRGPERHVSLGELPDQAARDELLGTLSEVAELRAALITDVDKRQASVYLGNGEAIQVPWKGLSWARPQIDENRQGPRPKAAADLLEPGDLVRLLRVVPENDPPYWRLAQIPAVEGALVSLDPTDGAILALVGGYDFYHSKFNRAVQAKRQPGSGFKAFIYSAALEAGFTPASLINDAPVVFDDPSLETAWRPENYSGKFFGPTRLRWALTKSRNLVSIRLLQQMGISHALEHIARFGFDPEQLPHNLSLALGSGVVTPLQMARGYSVLANGGYLVDPYLVTRIQDPYDGIVSEATPLRACPDCPEAEEAAEERHLAPRAISPENWYLMNSMMQDVITHGTAQRARALGRKDLAGKTGTTNDQRDAWFNGFQPSLVAVAWVGFDSSAPLGRRETGGRAALPAWMAYMREALKDVPEQSPRMPAGLVTVRIDPQTGLRVGAERRDAIFEIFRPSHVPEAAPSELEAPVTAGERASDAPQTLAEDPF